MKASEFRRNFRRLKNAWIPRQRKTATGKHRGPNATETRYRREVLGGIHPSLVSYESRSFAITRTTKREYTPDWTVKSATGKLPPEYHEVKGSYKLGSEDRARLAWEIAAEQNPDSAFYWAVLTRRGWEIEKWMDGGKTIWVKLASETTYRAVQPDWRRHRKHKTRSSHGKN